MGWDCFRCFTGTAKPSGISPMDVRRRAKVTCPTCGLLNHLDAGAVNAPIKCFGCRNLVSRLDPGASCVKDQADFIVDAQVHRAANRKLQATNPLPAIKVGPDGPKDLPGLQLVRPQGLHV